MSYEVTCRFCRDQFDPVLIHECRWPRAIEQRLERLERFAADDQFWQSYQRFWKSSHPCTYVGRLTVSGNADPTATYEAMLRYSD